MPIMNVHEKDVLGRINARLYQTFPSGIVAVYAFGSRVWGDHGGWTDFDVIVVREKRPGIETDVTNIFAEEEVAAGLNFTPAAKDLKIFELEKKFHAPFYENVTGEGVLL